MVPKIGSRRSDGQISRFRFYGENVGRSFIVCSHDPIFRTNQQSLIWRQNDHRDVMQKLAGAIHLSRRVSDEIEHDLFPFVFSKLRIRVLGGNFQYVHTIGFLEPTKIKSSKTDRVNGPQEYSLRVCE